MGFKYAKNGVRWVDAGPASASLMHSQLPEDMTAHTMQLRIWLPEKGLAALDELVAASATSRTAYLREFFVGHLYGEHELQRMRQSKLGIFYVAPPKEFFAERDSDVRFSRGPAIEAPPLGKNVEQVKVFVHERIKSDLLALAKLHDKPAGRYLREILLSRLLGWTIWPDAYFRLSMNEEIDAARWESAGAE